MTAMVYTWLAVAIVMGIVEGVTYAMVSVWFAGGAAAAMIAALLGLNFKAQLVCFVVVSAILLACLRPLAKKKGIQKPLPTNVHRMIGMVGVVTEDIDNIAATGAVKLSGVEWCARARDGHKVPVGERVKVVAIDGVKVIVEPVAVLAKV